MSSDTSVATPSESEVMSHHGDIPLGDATVAFHWSPQELEALERATSDTSSTSARKQSLPQENESDSLRRRRTDTLVPVNTPNLRALLDAPDEDTAVPVTESLEDSYEKNDAPSLRELTRASMEVGSPTLSRVSIQPSSFSLASNPVRPAHETLTDDPSFHQSLPELPPDPAEAIGRIGAIPTSFWDGVRYVIQARRLQNRVHHIQQVLSIRNQMLLAEHNRLLNEAGRVTWATGEALEPSLQPKLDQVLKLENELDDLRSMCHRLTESWERENSRMIATPVRKLKHTNSHTATRSTDVTKQPSGTPQQLSGEDDVLQRKQRLEYIRAEYERKLQAILEELRGKETELVRIYDSVVEPLKKLGLTQLELGRPKYLAGQFRRLRSCQEHDAAMMSQVQETLAAVDHDAIRRGKWLIASFGAMVIALSALALGWWGLS
jgi:hypothetical protein